MTSVESTCNTPESYLLDAVAVSNPNGTKMYYVLSHPPVTRTEKQAFRRIRNDAKKAEKLKGFKIIRESIEYQNDRGWRPCPRW